MPTRGTSAEASQGPDWADVHTYLTELHKIHGVQVSIGLRVGPGMFMGAIEVRMIATAPQLTGPGQTWCFELVRGFPTPRCKTLTALVYQMLHQIDYRAARELYVQERFA